jgi:hypothetical protein
VVTPTGRFRKGIPRALACVSHKDSPEVLLIRVSHWLWKWYRAENRPTYLSFAIGDMVRVKMLYREPRKADLEAASERMRKMRKMRRGHVGESTR